MRTGFDMGMRRLGSGWVGALAFALTLQACSPSEPAVVPGSLSSSPLAARTIGDGERFRLLTPEESGVPFENRFEWGHPREHLYPHGYAGGGVAIGDVDENGLPDLYLTSQVGLDRLYLQVSPLRFEDATERAGLAREVAWGTGVSFADVDGDGHLDLYVCNYDAPNRLFLGDGTGRFEDVSAASGADFAGASVAPAFADYDGDGDLDLYVVTNRLYPGAVKDQPRTTNAEDGSVQVAPGFEEAFAVQVRPGPGGPEKFIVKAGQRDRLYANDGAGVFADVSAQAGIAGNHPGLSATWWDYDHDGRPDLYVCNDFWDADRLYHNEGGGRFKDELATSVPHTPWFSMGADFADVDGDGLMDLLVADMAPTSHYMSKIMMGDMNDSRWFLEAARPPQYMRNALYRGTGTSRFMEVAHLAGLDSSDWSWSLLFGDLDDDARVDLFVTNGTANHSFDPDLTARLRAVEERHASGGPAAAAALYAEQWELYREVPPRRERNLAFRNVEPLRFEEVGAAWGLDLESVSFGAALSDLDRDGDLDVVVSNVGAPISIYENTGRGRSALVQLRGSSSPKRGEGAEVEVETAAGRDLRQVFRTHGYMSAGEALLHFGLGSSDRIDRLSVRWPSGHQQTFKDLAAGNLYTITEPGGAPPAFEPAPAPPARFVEVAQAIGLDVGGTPERVFDDFAAQPLLPARLSRIGPGIALGDADGDGDDDVWVGGARGVAGSVFTNVGGGRFVRQAGGPWDEDRACEDTAGVWLDVEGDGDLDLYVGSGSNEWAEGSPFLRDRLYLNQGDWRFVRAPFERLPDVGDSTGTVAAADYDRDGDLDLFVGARSIPGRYPEPPASRLLRNEGGTFSDVTDSVAPGLGRAGLVTAALWSDVDDDGDVDLWACLEWGAVALWLNGEGRLTKCTFEGAPGPPSGWWNGIAGADLDGDGDLDYAVTNAGWNTKYEASAEAPVLLLYGAFEEGGAERLLEVKSKAGTDELLPVRGLSCSSDAMPFVGERMPSYHDFASATLDEIYPPSKLSGARTFRATELASGVLWNETGSSGGPEFRFEPFPRLAQAAPGYGVHVGDLTGDGAADVYFVQNFFGREPETGRWDGGLSQLLVGDGAGELAPVPVRSSGLSVSGDATAVAIGDLDGDGRPDALVGRNEERLLGFRQRDAVQAGGRFVAVRLAGPPGNPAAVGARVTCVRAGGIPQAAEVHAGGGHLSQSSATLFFGLGADESCELRVRWPDGTSTTHSDARGTIVISR